MAAASLAAGCAAARTPLFTSPDLAGRDISTIAVAPMVDERAFPETQLPVSSYVAHAIAGVLERKGYTVAPVDDVGLPRLTSPLASADAGAFPKLASRYALWIAVERLETDDSALGLDTRVRLAGVLVDSESGEVLWRDRAERESSISGAGVAVLSPSVRTNEAVFLAVTSLLETFPDRLGSSLAERSNE